MNIFGALSFAFLAALGNALYASGQKQSSQVENALSFIMWSALIATALAFITAPVISSPQYLSTFKSNWLWILISGVGLYITYIGFYFLYSRYGTTYYILYAVLSIITTSVLLGLVYFKEVFNIYHWAALLFAIMTMVLFSIGQTRS